MNIFKEYIFISEKHIFIINFKNLINLILKTFNTFQYYLL